MARYSKVFVVAVTIEVVYQLIMLRWLYPLQALIVGTLVAIVPYVLIRGLVMHLARKAETAAFDAEIGVYL